MTDEAKFLMAFGAAFAALIVSLFYEWGKTI